jgi:hypothetical protein
LGSSHSYYFGGFLSSETIIEIIGLSLLFFLVVAFFIFNSQFHILLNRLLNQLTIMEFRRAEYKIIDTDNIAPDNLKPWTWYKAVSSTLPFPRTAAGEKLISEGNISLRQAFIWLIFASIFYTFLISVPQLIRNTSTITLLNILILLGVSLLGGLLSLISFIFTTTLIHLIAKLFRSKGAWRNFFIVYVAFNLPIMILSGFAALTYQVFASKFAILLEMLLPFYWLLIIDPIAIKANYRFSWVGAFLINFFVAMVIFFSIAGLYIVANPSILQR